jgi:hypothetical protein
MKKLFYFLLFLFCLLCHSSCSIFSGTLNLEAAIIYQFGGAQPVAKEKFYLLDQDLEQIVKEAGETEDFKPGTGDYKRPYNMEDVKFPSLLNKQFRELQPIIAKHIKYTLETDFQGKAQLSNISIGTYYLYGVAETRKGSSVWNLKVEINRGDNKISLSQNNALYAY